jgi:hypothetical protein
MWARTRTRNGKIAWFFSGWLLLLMAAAFLALGGIGAGLRAIRSGKAGLIAEISLSAVYVQAILASVLLGFGMNSIFSETELRRYPLRARQRRFVRHFIGIADPFWFLFLALQMAARWALSPRSKLFRLGTGHHIVVTCL